jgi:uncharacterized protein (DUF433 family)
VTKVPEAYTIPLYTIAEAAHILRIPPQTLAGWARGYDYRLRNGDIRHSEPLVTEYGPSSRHRPTIPFIGLAEASFLVAVKETGVPMVRIRPALAEIKRTIGLDHALANRALLTDGGEILRVIGAGDGAEGGLLDVEVVRNHQGVLTEAIEGFARHITYGPSGYAEVIALPQFREVPVVVNPEVAFGRPYLVKTGVQVESVLDRYVAGDGIDLLATDFELTDREIEELLRAELRQVVA